MPTVLVVVLVGVELVAFVMLYRLGVYWKAEAEYWKVFAEQTGERAERLLSEAGERYKWVESRLAIVKGLVHRRPPRRRWLALARRIAKEVSP